jgi:hypothetical protein
VFMIPHTTIYICRNPRVGSTDQIKSTIHLKSLPLFRWYDRLPSTISRRARQGGRIAGGKPCMKRECDYPETPPGWDITP